MRLLALLLALALLPTAAAMHAPATVTLPVGAAEVYATPADCAAGPATSFEAGATGRLCVRWNLSRGGNASAPANVTLVLSYSGPTSVTFAARNATVTLPANATATRVETLGMPFAVGSEAAAGDAAISIVLTQTKGGATLGNATAGLHVGVLAPPVPPEGPNYLLLGGLAVLVVAAGGGAYALLRKRQVKAAPRSQAMRHMEMEKRLEKAKEPEEKAAIQAEIREEEAARALSREAQIVEAKMKDVRSGLDRLKERFDAGQLTQHQYAQMRAKREATLEDLEREFERLRGGSG